MTLRDTRLAEFAHLNDSQVAQLYLDAEAKRKAIADDADATGNWSDDTERKLNAIESELFLIDSELCARDLPLPR